MKMATEEVALRESLAATVRRSVEALSFITGAAAVAISLNRDGAPQPQTMAAVLSVLVALDLAVRALTFARLAGARGSEQFARLRKHLRGYRSSLGVIYLAAFVGALEIWRGHVTAYAIGLVIVFVAAGLLVQFRLKPAMEQAWERLRELDSGTS
jgi:hypothetical protein